MFCHFFGYEGKASVIIKIVIYTDGANKTKEEMADEMKDGDLRNEIGGYSGA